MTRIVYKVETEIEEDGRSIEEIQDLPGVLAYGATEQDATARTEALALFAQADSN